MGYLEQSLPVSSPAPATVGVRARVAALWASRGQLRKIGPALNARRHLRKATRLGNHVTLHGKPKVVNQGTMTFGDRVRLDSGVATLELVALRGGLLEIGDNVFINYSSSLVASTHVRIGNDSLIGTHVMVMDTDFHRVEDKAYDTSGKPVILEERVWLGNRSMVLKGVTIGHDSVVAAGSVVTSDVPPRSIVAGVPAKVVRTF